LCSSNASFGSKAVDFERTALDVRMFVFVDCVQLDNVVVFQLDLRENGLPVFPDEIGKRQVVKVIYFSV
jgi:hypothetical protein